MLSCSKFSGRERSLKRVEPFLNLIIVSTDRAIYGWMCIIHCEYNEILLISNSLQKYFRRCAYVMDGKKPGIHI